ncbi:MAG: hypothetical protein ACPGVG_18170 [Mycobacterium sp.]
MEFLDAVTLTHAANCTRYRLLITVDPQGGYLVCWPDVAWFGWFGDWGDQVRTHAGKHLSNADLEEVRRLCLKARVALIQRRSQ